MEAASSRGEEETANCPICVRLSSVYVARLYTNVIVPKFRVSLIGRALQTLMVCVSNTSKRYEPAFSHIAGVQLFKAPQG